MKRQTAIQTQKETMPLQMRSFLPHAAVSEKHKYDLPSHGSRETRFDHDFSQVAIRPSAPIVSQDYSNASCPMVQQRCPFGGACHTCPPRVQAKLKVGQAGDKYEQEADRVADQVMRMPTPRLSSLVDNSSLVKSTIPRSGTVQRVCASCLEEQKNKESNKNQPFLDDIESASHLENSASVTTEDLAKENGSVVETVETNTDEEEEGLLESEGLPLLMKRNTRRQASPDCQCLISNQPSNEAGQRINTSNLKQYEKHFGRDLSSVRIHHGNSANRFTDKLGAVAATVGNHIYVNNNLENHNRQWLMAHELTHVVQQNSVPMLKNRRSKGRTVTSEYNLESEANRTADKFLMGKPVSITGRAPRQPQLYQATICRGRDNEHASTQQRDFPSTYISTVNVALDTLRITLDWTGPSATAAARDTSARTGGFIRFSPGAGVRGQTSCNVPGHSQNTGSCCTPIGTFTAGGQSCVTPSLSLQNFTNFQRSGVGFHYYHSVPRVPASHGCIRLFRAASEVLFDNIRPDVTSIVVSGRATGHRRHRSCS